MSEVKKKKGGATHPKKKNDNGGFDPKFDEDVDDDLAFDSDDERQYGDFFSKVKGNKKKGGGDGKKGGAGIDDTFNDLYDPGNDNSDDDGDGEFDLSDMLDDDASKKKSKSKASTSKKSAVATKASSKLKQASARDLVTREGESLFSDSGAKTTAGAKLSKLVKEVGAGDKKNKADEKISKRLTKAVQEKETIFDADVDEEVKELADRSVTRDVVSKDGKKWAPVLKELKRKRNVQFPLPGAEESAIPQTLGAIATGADPAAQKKGLKVADPKKRNRDGDDDTESAKKGSKIERAKNMTSTMSNLLLASGLSGRIQNAPAGSAEAKAVEKKLLNEREYVALNDLSQQQQEGEEGGDVQPPVKLGYVRQLKSMMQYELSKRRRLNKIKSKTYRRILRKEKDREVQDKERSLELNNPELALKRKTEKMEKMRAIERATQKHKNTSKWIKHVKRYSKFDEETRDAVHDQYHEHQRLMSKMEEDAAAQLKEDAADSSSEDEEKRVDRLLAADNHTLRQGGLKSTLWGDAEAAATDEALDMSDPTTKARSQLQQMGFMQRAKDRHTAEDENDFKNLLDDVQRHKEGKAPLHADMAADDQDGMDDETRAQLAKEDKRALNRSLGGHSVLTRGQGAKDKRQVDAKAKAAQEKIDADQANRNLTTGRKTFGGAEAKGANLAALPSKGLFAQQAAEEEFEEDEETEEEDEDEEEESDSDESSHGDAVVGASQLPKKKGGKSLVLGGSSVVPDATNKKLKKVSMSVPVAVSSKTSAVDPTTAADEEGDAQQDYLVSRAFAGDNVDEDFLKMKEQQVETIMKPQDPNASLPGWGEWGGEDEDLNRAHKKRVEASELSRKIEKSTLMRSRVDSNMDHVVVNHDVDLVPSGYNLKIVPRPFANAKEFTRHMRQPLGPEWNTATTYRDGVQPRITTKQGAIIDPLSKRTGTRKAKTSMRKKRNRGTEDEK